VLVLSLADDVLARARALLQGGHTPPATFQVLPKTVPVPETRHRLRTGTSREADKFVLRMPDDMRERIAGFASLHHRSSNSECIVALEWWMDRQALMWTMLQATERELTRLEGEEQKTLDDIVQRLPQTKAAVDALKVLIRQG
jgi:hypothetical protein